VRARLVGGLTARVGTGAILVSALLLLAPIFPLAPDCRAGAAEGKIDNLKDKLDQDDKQPKKPSPARPAGERRAGLFDDDENPLGVAFLFVLAAPFWLPPAILDDRPLPPCKPFRFEEYPYKDGARGFLRMGSPGDESGRAASVPEGNFFSFRTAYTFELNSSDMLANRAELLVRSAARFNLDVSATDYAEDLGGDNEHLQHYQAHLTYTFAASELALFAAGIGVRSLHFEDGYDATGVDFRYEAEFYPARPLSFSFIAEAGQVRESSAWELEARAGWHLGRFEAFAGYRHFRAAGEDFAGPLLGMAVTF
jgi:hypothetical protein